MLSRCTVNWLGSLLSFFARTDLLLVHPLVLLVVLVVLVVSATTLVSIGCIGTRSVDPSMSMTVATSTVKAVELDEAPAAAEAVDLCCAASFSITVRAKIVGTAVSNNTHLCCKSYPTESFTDEEGSKQSASK